MVEITNLINAKIWIENKIIDSGISIVGTKIGKIGKESSLPKSERIIDLKGKLILPGLIDVHAHIRDFDYSYKETFFTATSAAVAGGFTTILDMTNSKPSTSSPDILKKRIKIASGKIFCDVGFFATPTYSNQVSDLVNSGCLALKIHMAKSINIEKYQSLNELTNLFEKTTSEDIVVAIHAEDSEMIIRNKEYFSPQIHAKSHPVRAEEKAIETAIKAAQITKAKIHICHVSTLGGLSKIKKAKRNGIDISCETTPHYTLLTNKIFKKFGSKSIVEPPLRTSRHTKALLKGILTGDVDIIASDHAPHTLEEKNGGKPGFPGLETTVPIFFTLVKDGVLDLDRVIGALTIKPAKRFSLQDVGKIKLHNIANLTVIDFNVEDKINSDSFYSKAKFSPFNGMIVKAKVYATFVRGKLVFINDEICEKAKVGKVLRKKKYFY